MPDNVVMADQTNFGEVIQGTAHPVVVDFWASWCMPCRMVAPILEELAAERPAQLTIAKVNVDENPALAAQFGVMSIPTLIRFQDGQEAARVVGALPKVELVRKLGL